MAQRAIRGEPGSFVIWIGCGVVILQMARSAIGGRARVLSAHVTAQTRDCRMHPRERILRVGGVIEVGVGPVRGGMADRAIGRPAEGHVIRICDRLVLLQMAAHAISGKRRVVVADMAGSAKYRGMGTSERELGFAVIKARAKPRCR